MSAKSLTGQSKYYPTVDGTYAPTADEEKERRVVDEDEIGESTHEFLHVFAK